MQCPLDQNQLVMTERQGVEIDYCPVCRGVWLDRGELDKILERSAVPAPAAPAAYGTPGPAHAYGTPDPLPYDDRGRDHGYDRERDRERDRDRDRGYGDRHDGRRRKKRESWLEDIFDF